MADTSGAREETSPEQAESDDIALMLRVKDGDLAAFQQLVETHQYRVVGTVTKMLGNEADAEDIAQQVFVRVWKSAKRYKPSAKFTTWLYTITRNLVFNEIRRRKRHPVEPLETELGDHAAQLEDRQMTTPDASYLEEELQSAIKDAIAALPENQRMAVVLRRYEELTYEEIADVMKTSVSAVKSLLFRARSELKISLKRYLES